MKAIVTGILAAAIGLLPVAAATSSSTPTDAGATTAAATSVEYASFGHTW